MATVFTVSGCIEQRRAPFRGIWAVSQSGMGPGPKSGLHVLKSAKIKFLEFLFFLPNDLP